MGVCIHLSSWDSKVNVAINKNGAVRDAEYGANRFSR